MWSVRVGHRALRHLGGGSCGELSNRGGSECCPRGGGDALRSGPEGQAREIEAVVDTGYSGVPDIAAPACGELNLHFVTSGEATLADGSAVSLEIRVVTVGWMARPDMSRQTLRRPRRSSMCNCLLATIFIWK